MLIINSSEPEKMAVNHLTYTREFLSETYHEDISHHGSPEYFPMQRTSKLDVELRKKIFEDFSYYEQQEDRFDHGIKTGFGFDGKVKYRFEITGNPTVHGDKNAKYAVKVNITKAGNKKDLSELSDLEVFLITAAFLKD